MLTYVPTYTYKLEEPSFLGCRINIFELITEFKQSCLLLVYVILFSFLKYYHGFQIFLQWDGIIKNGFTSLDRNGES